ncbi:MAG: CinA family nicotinamide mononucleotide deamidase-related protein [Balneolaceae bacterium]|nr:MAG: CinA family nicotinamide mononucleotide deamidase-related protein [Balneolaceae bacterium]
MSSVNPSTHSAAILTIGNELLNGDVVNTNASWLGQTLRGFGVPCETVLTITDRKERIIRALEELWVDHDLVIISGGLGPTRDDVTKLALLDFFNDTLVRDTAVLEHVSQYFLQRGRAVSEVNRAQADVPARATVLFNDLGTAPGLLFEQEGRLLAAMPGVPYELHHITEKRLIPELEKRWKKSERRVLQRYYRTTGIGESDLSDRVLTELEHRIPPDVDIAFLPHPQGVDIRITQVNGRSGDAFLQFVEWISDTAGDFIYSEDYRQSLAARIVELLGDGNQTLALAESCSGGYLADALTDVPGSSRCFAGGVVAYSNDVKVRQLGVDPGILEAHGAVSAPVALAMAKGAAITLGTDFGISTTGVAGPSGGTPVKPVGTVWIGFWAADGAHFACRFHFTTERLVNKERSFAAAMDLLRRHVTGVPGFPYHPEVVRGTGTPFRDPD